MQRTLQEINIEIEATKKELETVHGTETEVFLKNIACTLTSKICL